MSKKLPTWVAVPAVCVASALLATGVNGATRDQIDRQAAKRENAPLAGVIEAADRFEPTELQESRYAVDGVYTALDAAGAQVGYVGKTTVSGYGGPIEITAGVDNEGVITGVTVGGDAFNETPGLGGLTREPRFARQFVGKTAGVDLNEGENTEGVDGIAGATISSRAVLGGVKNVVSYISAAELGILEEKETVYMGPTVSAVEKGFAGDVTVTAGLDDTGAIAYLNIQTPDETEGIGKRCSEPEFIHQFIGKKGPFAYGEDGVEAVSGATFTSNAVINALNTIASGGGTASEGLLSATVQGFGGDVTVNVMLNPDNSVSALSIDTPDETEGLGKRASEPEFTDQFIGKHAPFAFGEDGIEALSGATVTSTAVLDALNDLVPGDGAAPAAEATAPVAVEAEAPDETEAPVVGTSAEDMMRERPVESALANADAPGSTAQTGVDRLMRERPVDFALANADTPGNAAGDNADRLMRERPVEAALENVAEVEPDVSEEAVTKETDASRLMRVRPAEAALENVAKVEPDISEEAVTKETDASRLMRARPAEGAPENVGRIEPAVAVEIDASRLMRARPAETAPESDSGEEAPNYDKYMRPRPATAAGA